MSGPGTPRPCAAVVVAAGKGLRAGQPLPKQFAPWRGRPVVRHSVEALAAAGIAPIAVVIPQGDDRLVAGLLAGIAGVRLVTGGATRQQSVRLGLEAIAGDAPINVLIHDAARPTVPAGVIARLLEALDSNAAAIPVLPVVDSMLVAQGARMAGTVDRNSLRRVQTPQAFHFGAILAAHQTWSAECDAGDDAQVARAGGIEVALVEGDEALHKLTYAADFAIAAGNTAPPPIRVGTGYDVHRLAEGESLWLCGVRIEHSHGLAGHSDADVAIHALVDAILGAAGAGDIGQHFPPSDPQWRGAASDRFLRHAVGLAAAAGYAIGNVDLTIICEAPRIGPHRPAMRQRLADLLGIDIALVSVKATTTERLGFTGREEGIAAQAIATLVRNEISPMRAVAMLSAASLAIQPAVAVAATPCLTSGEFASLAQFALPSIVTGASQRCAQALPGDAFLRRDASKLAARYGADSRQSWPGAKAAFLKLSATGDEDSGKLIGAMPDPSLQQMLLGLVEGLVSSQLPLERCVAADRLIGLLAPLPAANTAGLVALLVEIGSATDKETPLGKPGSFNICRA